MPDSKDMKALLAKSQKAIEAVKEKQKKMYAAMFSADK